MAQVPSRFRNPFDYHIGYGETLEDIMGCDIHVFLEEKRKLGWEPLYPVEIGERFIESYCYEKTENGAAAISLPPLPDEVIPEGETPDDEERRIHGRIEAWLKSMSHSEIIDRLGGKKRRLYWDFQPGLDWRTCPLESRNYAYFAKLGNNHRGDSTGGIEPRGFPEDASIYTMHNRQYWEGDAHTTSWAMVSELLAHPILGNGAFPAVEWMRKNIPDPENTRMVFWMDN